MYSVIATRQFLKHLRKLDKGTQRLVKRFIDINIQNADDPRAKGKPLRYNLSGYWRYRIGDYRLICEINEREIVVIMIDIGHRSDIYL